MKHSKTIKIIFLLLLTAAVVMSSSCGAPPSDSGKLTEAARDKNDETPTATPIPKVSAAQKQLDEMTLEEKVYQMFFVTPEDLTGVDTVISAGDTTREALSSYPVGGIIYFAKNIKSRDQVAEMIANTQEYSKIPLFISIDEEGGRVARLGNADIGFPQYPPMRDVGDTGDPNEAYDVGAGLGKNLSELGFNVDFAPVADVLVVSNNEDIGDRSFGTDPELVAKMVDAEVRGMQENGVSSTLKHFPSNGSTSANTHYGYGECTRTLEEMRATEFIPFKAGIDAGTDFVMVAHMAAVNVTGTDTPSTLSSMIIQDLLRKELGFKKIVISDALNMGAITDFYSPEDAALEAVKAGVDLVLMSTDFKSAAAAIVSAVESGEISEERINESVLRILALKDEKGMLKQ